MRGTGSTKLVEVFAMCCVLFPPAFLTTYDLFERLRLGEDITLLIGPFLYCLMSGKKGPLGQEDIKWIGTQAV